jgi:hypothetical protein
MNIGHINASASENTLVLDVTAGVMGGLGAEISTEVFVLLFDMSLGTFHDISSLKKSNSVSIFPFLAFPLRRQLPSHFLTAGKVSGGLKNSRVLDVTAGVMLGLEAEISTEVFVLLLDMTLGTFLARPDQKNGIFQCAFFRF